MVTGQVEFLEGVHQDELEHAVSEIGRAGEFFLAFCML